MTRQEANEKIIAHIIKVVSENPDLRFNQILESLGITGTDFYEESVKTLEKVKNGRI